MTTEERKKCLLMLHPFEIEGKRADEAATEGQLEIFNAIVNRTSKRVQIVTPTQYGKSLFVALACVVVSCIQRKKVSIIAPKSEQARIIMRYYVEHLGDSWMFYSELEKDDRLERLRMEENKQRITLKNGGGIFVVSANANNAVKGFEAAMGAGSDIVIVDEASLIPDQIEATVFRMIAGRGDRGFYCKIGNPFYRNHFHDSWRDPSYAKVSIDYHQGIREGRYSESFIEEARRKPFFDVLYECKFPTDDAVDSQGYIQMFPTDLIDGARVDVEPAGELRMGVDVAEGGGDRNALVVKSLNYACVLATFQASDTMTLVGETINQAKEHGVIDRNVFIDSNGVGKGAFDRLREQRFECNSVKFSESADDPAQFLNKRAECYWRMLAWIREGGRLSTTSDWDELASIRYRVNSNGKVQIMPKEDMRKVGRGSPDVADALAMCFSRDLRKVIDKTREEIVRDRETLRQFDANRPRGGYGLTGSRYLRGRR